MERMYLQVLLEYVRGQRTWDYNCLDGALEISRHGVSVAIPGAVPTPRAGGAPEDPAPLKTIVAESLEAAIEELSIASIPSKVRWPILVEWALGIVNHQVSEMVREKTKRKDSNANQNFVDPVPVPVVQPG